jgi:hypothetical protein
VLGDQLKQFKVAGGEQRGLFDRAGKSTIEQSMGPVVHRQYQLIQQGYQVAAHKQFLATKTDFEKIILSGVDPEMAESILEQGLSLTQTTGERAGIDPLTLDKMQDELRGTFKDAAKNAYEQAVDAGNVPGAQNGLDLLLKSRAIDPAEYKRLDDELPVTIQLTQARRAFLGGDSKTAETILQGVKGDGLSTDQLGERAKLLRASKEQSRQVDDQTASGIFLELNKNNKADPTTKAKVADAARGQITASAMQDSEKRAMWNFVGAWEDGKGIKTNWQRLSDISTKISQINDLSSAEDFKSCRKEFVQMGRDSEISPEDFGKLDDRLNNILPASQSSALARGVEYAVSHKLIYHEPSLRTEKPDFEQAIHSWVKQQERAGKTVGGAEVYAYARELAATWKKMTPEQQRGEVPSALTVGAAPGTTAKEVLKRNPGESVADYLKRTGAK